MHVNGAGPDFNAPFGGYKQSGNGREWGTHGLEEFLEVKAILGGAASKALDAVDKKLGIWVEGARRKLFQLR